ncbi:hypothetical protein NDU88_006427 [Pleurodeles waltl]|uniref:Uncharacterized protein n=1 Tax=Pleurodeles waltl TaxID=8319 RepID=A0AAV7U0B2_PLEWA|nr:hypothetical protein NDU88_006427 [Pleurodeles waltl]
MRSQAGSNHTRAPCRTPKRSQQYAENAYPVESEGSAAQGNLKAALHWVRGTAKPAENETGTSPAGSKGSAAHDPVGRSKRDGKEHRSCAARSSSTDSANSQKESGEDKGRQLTRFIVKLAA